jgi:DNA-binding CsgD family transcriptional regulator
MLGEQMSALQFIEDATGVFTSASDTYELCRNIVHSELLGVKTSGAQLISIDQKGQLRSVASYGKSYPVSENLSLWDENQVSKALGEKRHESFEFEGAFVNVLPFYRSMAPVGGLIVISSEKVKPFEKETLNIFAQLGAFYLDTNGLNIKQGAAKSEGNPDELTDRQREVLSYMSLGQTNAEIARTMLLSESTIRQETVRIYRSLGVSSRSEASKKGRALGLIQKQVPAQV